MSEKGNAPNLFNFYTIMLTTLEEQTHRLTSGHSLSVEEASSAAYAMAREEIPATAKEEFLRALGKKGETATELAAFAGVFRELARNPHLEDYAGEAIDLCGTGGDRQGTANISSITALLLASAGVPVFKHGNRSVTSRCGSADFLQALGIPWEVSDGDLRKAMKELNFVFFFAPLFHPAFKSIMPVRQKMAAQGERTVFNLLGPLVNPGKPGRQLLGVFAEPLVPLLGEALSSLGTVEGATVHGRLKEGGLDEVSTAGTNVFFGFGRFAHLTGEVLPEDYGFPTSPLADLKGGDLAENLALFTALQKGQAPVGLAHSVQLNAAFAFHLAGRCGSVTEGLSLAREQISSGQLTAYLEKVRTFFADLGYSTPAVS